MNHIQFISRETAYTVLAATALLPLFAVAGIFVGHFMPVELDEINQVPFTLAAISVGTIVFVWSIFRLIKPVGYDRNWQIAEMILVPLYWLTLMLAATVCLAWLIQGQGPYAFIIVS